MTRIYGLTGRRLPVHPHPLPDELLTHWFMRLAHANGLKAQSLANRVFGTQSSFWARDQDKLASQVVIERLSELTGQEPDDLRALTLAAYEGTLYCGHNPFGNTRWILPLGIYHRTRRGYGTQFCPLCLFNDSEPYFRRRWRLALVTMCDRHGIMLHDRCPACEAPIIWFRNELGHRRELAIGKSAICWQCGFDLRRAPAIGPPAIDGQSIMALRSLVAFHDLGWWFVGDRNLPYAHLYFDALRHLLAWLPHKKWHKLLKGVATRAAWQTEYPYARAFEARTVNERHHLLATAVWLLQDWPNRFIGLASETGLSQAHVLYGQRLPCWFESEVRSALGAGFGSPSVEEVASAASHLRQQGVSVSAHALERLIGSRDARAVLPYAVRGRPPLTDEEFWRVIAGIDAEMRRCKRGSQKRFLLWRDRTMFIVERVLRKKLSEVRMMTIEEGMRAALVWPRSSKNERRTAAALKAYLRLARPRIASDQTNNVLFPSGVRPGCLSPQGWNYRWKLDSH